MNWISVKDKLPDNAGWCNDIVLFWDCKVKTCRIGCYDYEMGDWTELPWSNGRLILKFEDVTHWQPLPEPPKH